MNFFDKKLVFRLMLIPLAFQGCSKAHILDASTQNPIAKNHGFTDPGLIFAHIEKKYYLDIGQVISPKEYNQVKIKLVEIDRFERKALFQVEAKSFRKPLQYWVTKGETFQEFFIFGSHGIVLEELSPSSAGIIVGSVDIVDTRKMNPRANQ